MLIAEILFATLFHTASNVRHILLCCTYLVVQVKG